MNREQFHSSDSVNLPADIVADCDSRRILVIVAGEVILDMDAATAWRFALRMQSKTLAVRETIERSRGNR